MFLLPPTCPFHRVPPSLREISQIHEQKDQSTPEINNFAYKNRPMWKYYALLSALFAALTAIFAKIGVKGINSNLATAIRTVIILLITWGIVIAGNNLGHLKELNKTNWLFLILSGAATGLSWLFYFKALQMGDASKVAPIDKLSVVLTILLSFIILKEPVSAKVLIGGSLITVGTLVIIWN